MASFEIHAESVHDPDSRYLVHAGREPDPDAAARVHPLDEPKWRGLWSKLWSWWNEARDAHFHSRALRLRDHEMYDGRQWTDEEIAGLEARGQAPLVFNVLAQAVDWIVGTERRTRVDWNVLPRQEEDVENASLKKELLKYISDVNKLGWQRSFAFKDSVISGLGLLEDCVVSAANEEPIHSRYVDWKCFWWDPNSRDPMFRDARYLIRQKYLDLDYAVAMWPDRADLLRAAAQTKLDPGLEMLEDDALISSLYLTSGVRSIMAGSSALVTSGCRERVRVFEVWYRTPVKKRRLESVWPIDDDPLHGVDYDPDNPEHVDAAGSPIYTLTEAVTDRMMVAFMTDTGLLDVKASPYKHGRYPFTAFWAYRDHITGMPYGVVRRAIDPQRDYNKRRSKALHLLLNSRVIYEDDAFVEGREEEALEEIGRPDGQVRVRKGAIEKVKIDEHQDIVDGHLRLMEEDRTNIHESTGVTRDNVGQDSNAVSGRAIIAKQQQGAVTTAEIFDNYRLGMVESGEKSLCNTEQFMSLPKVFRILGPSGEAEWMRVNDPVYNEESGDVEFNNDITKYNADFVVDQQDYRETMRMALAETLFEMLGKLPPEAALNLLDIAVDLLDLPNKAALANRIRGINGQAAPGTENTEQAMVERLQREAQQQADQDLERQDREADIRLKHAKANQADAGATNTNLQGKRAAMDTAGLVSAALPLAPAADRLYEGSRPRPSLSRPAPEIEAAA